VQIVLDEATVVLPLADVIDIAKERERLAKEKAKAEAEIAKIDGRMANADFVAKAPTHVLEDNNERKVNFTATIARLDEALKRLA
jgi:valyl-tRNA synthetase